MSSPKTYIALSVLLMAPSNISGIIKPRSSLIGLPPHFASNCLRVGSCFIGRYIVRYVGRAPTSLDPWTLFWPRSGFEPPPGTPKLPVSIARFARHRTPALPCDCSVTPRPYEIEAGLEDA